MRTVFKLWAIIATAGLVAHPARAQRAAGIVADTELAAVQAEVVATQRKLGDKAGVPDEAETYQKIPKKGRLLTKAEAQAAMAAADAGGHGATAGQFNGAR